MIKTTLNLSLVLVFFTASHFAFAGSIQSTLDVTATAVDSCTNISTSPVDFGVLPDNKVVQANGDITVTCSSGASYNIALDGGHLPGSGIPERFISNATHNLSYDLFKDSGFTNYWGDSDFANTYPWGTSLSDTGTGNPQSHTVYGTTITLPLSTGTYSDTVNVTVHF